MNSARLAFFLALCLALAGCGYRGLGGSFVGALPPENGPANIAADAAGWLAEAYAPGHTAVYLMTPEKDAHNAFSTAFENALRQKGFTIAAEASSQALGLSYVLDAIEGDKDSRNDGAWYLQLRLSDGRSVARAYTASGFPEAGRSATALDARSFPQKTSGAEASSGMTLEEKAL